MNATLEHKAKSLSQLLGWDYPATRCLPEPELDEALSWAKQHPNSHRNGTDQLSMFSEDFGEKAPPVRCRIRPKQERREHAGGAPEVAFDEEEHTPAIGFDFEAVYRHLDGEENRASLDAVAAACAMIDILDWIEEPWRNDRVAAATDRVILCKRHVFRLIMRPDSLGCPTLTQLANRLGVTKQFLSKLVTDFRDRFGIVSVWMKSDEARDSYRDAHLME